MKSNYSILPVFWKAEELKFNGMLTLSRRKTEQDFYAHAHDYFELEYILSGKGVHWLNGKAYPMAPGSFYLLTPTDVHALQVEEPLELYNISFSEQILLGSPLNESLLRSSGTHLQLSDKEGQRLLTLISQLAEEVSAAQEFSAVYLQSLVQCIVVTLLRRATESPQLPQESNHIPDALLYVHRHFREPITLEDVSSVVGLSPHYFCETFSRTEGLHFTEYLNRLRAQYAYHLLIAGDLSMTEVCYTSGFGSYASFSRSFRKEYGMTPTQIRKNRSL